MTSTQPAHPTERIILLCLLSRLKKITFDGDPTINRIDRIAKHLHAEEWELGMKVALRRLYGAAPEIAEDVDRLWTGEAWAEYLDQPAAHGPG